MNTLLPLHIGSLLITKLTQNLLIYLMVFVLVQYAGTIHFSPHFQLDNVMYARLFNMNLISISKLCQSLNCYATFHNNKCFLHDLHSQKMIGLGDQIEGLYRLALDSFNTPLCNNLSVNHISTNTNLTIPSSSL